MRPSGRLSGSSIHVEFYPLSERQAVAVVQRASLAAHVCLPGVGAGFAAAAGFFLAAEGPADLGAAGADVHVGDAAVAAGGRKKALGFLETAGEDRRGETLR